MTDETATPRCVTFRETAYTLAGAVPEIGQVVPNFRLSKWLDATRIEVTLDDTLSAGLPVLFSVVQSVDAPISRLQAKTFDLKLAEFEGAVVGAQVSSDLPNTINRFLYQEDILRLDGLSDYFDQNFGRAFGVLIEEARILTRAVFVIDWQGVLHHAEVVPEITQQPDYESAIAVLRRLVVNAPGAIA